MTKSPILFFDVETDPIYESHTIYALSEDGFLYTSDLLENASDMTWRKSKVRCVDNNTIDKSGLMQVYNGAAYVYQPILRTGNASVLYSTRDMGDSWATTVVPRGYYNGSLLVNENFILLASRNQAPTAVIKSTDGGTSWTTINQSISSLDGASIIRSSEAVIAIGGYSSDRQSCWISISSISGMDVAANWNTYYSDIVGKKIGASRIANIAVDETNSIIYVFQHDCVSYGTFRLDNSIIKIDWKTPLPINNGQSGEKYSVLALDCFNFAASNASQVDTICQPSKKVPDDAPGIFARFAVVGHNTDESMNYFKLLYNVSNPYANIMDVDAIGFTSFRKLKDAGSSYQVFLDNSGQLSLSNNRGKDWQKISINF